MKCYNKNIVITGIGIHDALGNFNNFENLLSNNINIVKLGSIKEFEYAKSNKTILTETAFDFTDIDINTKLKTFGLTDKELRRLVFKTKLSINVIYDALKDASIDLDTLQNKNVPIIFSPSYRNVEFTLNTDRMVNSIDSKNKKLNPFIISNYRSDFVSDFISIRHGLHGPTVSTSATCTTGLYNIDYAMKLLMTDDDYDMVIVGAGNYGLTPHEIFGFEQIGALNIASNGLSMPFDKNRNGFLLGQSAGCLILETLESAKKRNAKIYASIDGIGLSVDGNHLTSPDKDSKGATIALKKCLNGFTGQIDYINAHATSTPIGDQIEANLMAKYFPGTSISSIKGHIGHGIISANINEIIYTLLAMQHSIIPHTMNLENPLDANLDFVMGEPREKKIKYALKNSFGFGGRNGFILLKNMMV